MSQSFGFASAKIPHLVADGKTGLPGEIADLRGDVELGFENSEGRVGFPELDAMVGEVPVSTGGDITLAGRNLLQGQTFDHKALTSGTAILTLTAMKPGKSGIKAQILAPPVGAGGLSITYTDTLTCVLTSGTSVINLASTDPSMVGLQAEIIPPGAGGTLRVTFDTPNNRLVIRFADGGSTAQAVVDAVNATSFGITSTLGAAGGGVYTPVEPKAFVSSRLLTVQPAQGGSTASAVATLINANGSPCQGIIRATATAAGTGIATAVPVTPLAGGVGNYAGNKVTVAGIACTLKNTTGATGAAAWIDSGIVVTNPDMTAAVPPRASGDTVAIRIQSNGVFTSPLTAVLDGASGVRGPSGPSGVSGPSGASGPSGPSGHSGPSGPSGPS